MEDQPTLMQLTPEMLQKMQAPPPKTERQQLEEQFIRVEGAINEQAFRYSEAFTNYASQVAITLLRSSNTSILSADAIDRIVEESVKFTEAVREGSLDYSEKLRNIAPIPKQLKDMYQDLGMRLADMQEQDKGPQDNVRDINSGKPSQEAA